MGGEEADCKGAQKNVLECWKQSFPEIGQCIVVKTHQIAQLRLADFCCNSTVNYIFHEWNRTYIQKYLYRNFKNAFGHLILNPST